MQWMALVHYKCFIYKSAVYACAEIITTAFDTMEFYVNGTLMTADNVRPRYASRVCASFALNPSSMCSPS
jgi:hypothetical protein